MNWKPIKPSNLTDNYKITPPEPKRVNGHQPKPDSMFKKIWKSVKTTAVKQVAPFILDNLDIDFDANKPSGKDYVVIKVSVSFQGKVVFMRQKTVQL